MSNKYLDIAIEKVIKQEVNEVLEKIRAEIFAEKVPLDDPAYAEGCESGLQRAISIIDKYKEDIVRKMDDTNNKNVWHL